MLSSVTDALTPWTPGRILHIMEASSAAQTVDGGSGARRGPSASDEAAVAMESLLRLSNQQRDVAGRVMAAPLFAQRPLVEAAASSLSTSAPPFYSDAHRMCMHTLDLCSASPKSTASARVGAQLASDADGLASSAHPHPPRRGDSAGFQARTALAGLEELAFAAEFAEPCLRGSFPDMSAVLHDCLPREWASLLDETDSRSDGVKALKAAEPNALVQALQRLSVKPQVTHQKPLPTPEKAISSAAASSLRLTLTRPSTTAPETLLQPPLPPSWAVPIEAHGPPSHPLFDRTHVAHTFTEGEVEALSGSFALKLVPFQVYSRADVQARRREATHTQRRNAMLSAGVGAAPIVGPSRTAATSSAPHGGANVPAGAEVDKDGWSASSGWSSSESTERSDDEAEETKHEARDAHSADDRGPNTADKAAEVGAVAANTAPPTSSEPLSARTWVDDDGDLVFENGKLTIRKRKTRALKKPPPLPLPTMVRAPVLNPSAGGASSTVVATAQTGDASRQQRSPIEVDAVKDSVDEEEEEMEPRAKERASMHSKLVGGVKRSRRSSDDSAPSSPTSAGGAKKRPRLSVGTKAATRKSNAASEEASAALANKRSGSGLSGEEMWDFIAGLDVSDALRRALLIGVQTTPVNLRTEVSSTEEYSEASDVDSS